MKIYSALLSQSLAKCPLIMARSRESVFLPLEKRETSANLLDVRIFGVTAEAAGKLSLELMGQPSWNQAAAAKLASTVESVEMDTFEMCKQVYPAS